jgi:hypothetical protein
MVDTVLKEDFQGAVGIILADVTQGGGPEKDTGAFVPGFPKIHFCNHYFPPIYTL